MKESSSSDKKSRSSDSTSACAVSATVSSSSTHSSIIGKRSRIEELEAKSRASPTESTEIIEEPKPSTSRQPKPSTTSRQPSSDEPSLRLCLRLPSGVKEALSMYANDTIEVKQKYETNKYTVHWG